MSISCEEFREFDSRASVLSLTNAEIGACISHLRSCAACREFCEIERLKIESTDPEAATRMKAEMLLIKDRYDQARSIDPEL